MPATASTQRRGGGGDAGEVAEQVERGPLGGEQPADGRADDERGLARRATRAPSARAVEDLVRAARPRRSTARTAGHPGEHAARPRGERADRDGVGRARWPRWWRRGRSAGPRPARCGRRAAGRRGRGRRSPRRRPRRRPRPRPRRASSARHRSPGSCGTGQASAATAGRPASSSVTCRLARCQASSRSGWSVRTWQPRLSVRVPAAARTAAASSVSAASSTPGPVVGGAGAGRRLHRVRRGGEPRGVAADPGARAHRPLHHAPVRDGDHGQGAAAGRHRRAARRRSATTARATRAPTTRPSSSEFDARRLAPCSAGARHLAGGVEAAAPLVRPSTSVTTPPHA